MTSQIGRHFGRRSRDATWRQTTRTSDRVALRLAHVGVMAEMIGCLKSVRVQRRGRVRHGALLFLFENEASGAFPRQRDEVYVLFGIEHSSVTFGGASFSAPAASGPTRTSGTVRFFDKNETFRSVFLIAPRFVQRQRDDVERRTGLGNL